LHNSRLVDVVATYRRSKTLRQSGADFLGQLMTTVGFVEGIASLLDTVSFVRIAGREQHRDPGPQLSHCLGVSAALWPPYKTVYRPIIRSP
jgi:hypothetical protein